MVGKLKIGASLLSLVQKQKKEDQLFCGQNLSKVIRATFISNIKTGTTAAKTQTSSNINIIFIDSRTIVLIVW